MKHIFFITLFFGIGLLAKAADPALNDQAGVTGNAKSVQMKTSLKSHYSFKE